MKQRIVLFGAIWLSCHAGAGLAFAAQPPLMVAQHPATILVKGIIVDENGEPVVGASITEIGSTRGTISDNKGAFQLNVDGSAKLKISFLGYKTIEQRAKSNMNVKLVPDNALLDEVVVVGYGQQKKVNLTGAVANVDIEKTLGSRGEQDVTKALQGAIPGLTVLSNNGSLDGSPSISIRGLGTLSNNQNSSPLIVVDGVPTDDLSMINGNDIASISVLKDASSSAIYGARAAFGVILINTKQAKKGDRITVKYNGQFSWDQATVLPDYPSVPEQLRAGLIAKQRAGEATPELFGMYFDRLLPYAEAWQQQHHGKKGYTVMEPFVDMNNVGDYAFINGAPLYYADYDLRKIWYNNAAPSQSHSLSLSGSSGKTSFYTALNYDNKEDIMKFSPGKRNRYNAALNLQTDINDWLTAGIRFDFTRRRMASADPWSNIYQYLWRWGSYFIPSGIYRDSDGTEYDYRMVAMQKQSNRKEFNHDMLKMNVFAKANITKELTLNVDYTYQTDNFNDKSSNRSVYGMNWTGTKPTYIVTQSNSDATRSNRKMNRWVANAYLNYAHTFATDHLLNVMVGVNGENFSSDYFGATRTKLYNESFPELNLAYGDMKDATIDSNTDDRASAGYFGRLNYSFRDIYLLELNGRYDGSSRFRKGARWAFFPSFSLGYRFSEEAYWKKFKSIVSNGKLRFSYGQIGNEAIGNNMFLSTLTAYNITQAGYTWLNAGGTKLNAFTMPTWVSPSLTWERIQTKNLGLDLGFLDNQFTATIELYERLTKDMLAPGTAIPSAVGAEAPYTNAGALRSRGWELSLAWRKQFNKHFSLYANFSIGDSKVKVTKWNNRNSIIGHTNDVSYAYAGENWGDIWGFETDRYFTPDDFNGKNPDGSWQYKTGVANQTGIQTGNFVYGPGDIKFKDLNGDGKIDGGKGTLEDHGDLKVIGNCLPRYEYSFHIGGTYKGFDLDLFFQGVGKRDVWNISSFNFPMMRNPDLALYANQTKYNIYDPDNGIINISEDNTYPCLWPGNEDKGNVSALAAAGGSHNYYPQSKYLIHMSYLRLKNITLGYTLPKQLVRKASLQNLRLYVSANNLFLLHKGNGDLPLDPEINDGAGISFGGWGRTLPITRSWTIGLQVTL